MPTSRQQVLEFIRLQRSVTAGELSRSLRMTPANARHHLGILEDRGLVEVVGYRPPTGRGRPAKLFSPTEQITGHSLDLLASALLLGCVPSINQDSQDESLRLIVDQLISHTVGADDAGEMVEETRTSLTSMLYQAVQRLNQLNYAARWEAHSQAPRIIFNQCPYAAIINQHPELCRMDRLMLEDLLGTPVEQMAKLEIDSRGLKHCMFAVK